MRALAAVVATATVLCACGGATATVATPSPTQSRRTVERATLADVLQVATKLTYKLTYSMNGKVDGVAFAGRWVVYQRPPIKRVDILDGTTDLSFYLSETTAVVCPYPFKPPCREAAIDEVRYRLGVGLDDLLRENVRIFDAADQREDRIGGSDVTCFQARPDLAGKLSPGTRRIEACYTSRGVPMRIEVMNDKVELSLEGQLLLDTVGESDVTPPAGALGAP